MGFNEGFRVLASRKGEQGEEVEGPVPGQGSRCDSVLWRARDSVARGGGKGSFEDVSHSAVLAGTASVLLSRTAC